MNRGSALDRLISLAPPNDYFTRSVRLFSVRWMLTSYGFPCSPEEPRLELVPLGSQSMGLQINRMIGERLSSTGIAEQPHGSKYNATPAACQQPGGQSGTLIPECGVVRLLLSERRHG